MEKFVSLDRIIASEHLQIVHMPESAGAGGELRRVCTTEVNRPGLPLFGFYDHFDESRIQIIGNVEMSFLCEKTSEERAQIFDALFSRNIPAIVITRSLPVPEELVASAEKFGIPVLASNRPTSRFMSSLINFLNLQLAPCITRHGVLVSVYGEGILILGESGVGKSETAMELLKRGHRLIADDAVELRAVSDLTIVGSAPELIRYMIELRGIGLVDVRHIFGMGAVMDTSRIDFVVQLENWDDTKHYDRLGLESYEYEIMGHKIPSVTIPVSPGRNLAIIIEVAAANNRQKRSGYNAAEEFNRRLMKHMSESGAEGKV